MLNRMMRAGMMRRGEGGRRYLMRLASRSMTCRSAPTASARSICAGDRFVSGNGTI